MAVAGDVVQAKRQLFRSSNITYLWREARPVVQLVFLFRFTVGCAVGRAAGGELNGSSALMASAWLLVVLSIYLRNGVSDLSGDVSNGSSRPLAAGQLSPRLALRAAVACMSVGLASAAATQSASLLALTVAMAGLGWLYSDGPRPLKDHALASALTFLGGGLLTYLAGALSTGAEPTAEALGMIALLSAWMGVGGSSKDLGDVTGDALAGRRTLPIILGARRAARIIGAGCLVMALAAVALASQGGRHWLPALVLSVGALGVAVQLTVFAPTGERTRNRSAYRTFMVVQYAANAGFLASCALGPAA